MLEELVTDINSFNEKQVDNDVISETRTYFSIYNNKISQPFQKFWFTLSNAKYFTNYYDYTAVRFALNNKSTQIEKFISWIRKLSEYLKKLFAKTFDGITVDLPWKEYENYPFLLSFYTNQDIVFMDSNKNILTLDKLDNSNSYSILFEIKNLKIIKTELDSECMYTLKYNLSILMIQQEPQLDLKSYLLNKMNIKTYESHEPIHNHTSNSSIKPSLPFLSQLSSTTLKSDLVAKNELISETKHKMPSGSGPRRLVDLDELLQVKSRLIKVNFDSEDNKSDKQHIADLENTFIEQKNQLKKVKTKEKSLLKHLKKSKNKSDIVESKNELENNLEHKLDDNLENKLENELEHKLENELEHKLENKLENEFSKNNIKELSKDKKEKNEKKHKKRKDKTKSKSIDKNDVDELDEDSLEKELGLL